MTLSWGMNFILAFFMPAFFVVTGYCTNFNLPILRFLWKNIKTILLPSYLLYLLNRDLGFLGCITYGQNGSQPPFIEFIRPGIKVYLHFGGFFWFLSALFTAKITNWVINKTCHNIYYQLLVTVSIAFIGVIIHQYKLFPNAFFYIEAMMLLPFLTIGRILKNTEARIMSYGSQILSTYVLIILIYSIMNIDVPTVAYGSHISISNFLPYIFLSTMGTLGMWWLSKKINHCSLLEYMGQGSIVIYCFNMTILKIVGHTLVYTISPTSALESVTTFILVIITTLTLLTALYWLINHKYIRVILGKF